jgi:hypothetical protein
MRYRRNPKPPPASLTIGIFVVLAIAAVYYATDKQEEIGAR